MTDYFVRTAAHGKGDASTMNDAVGGLARAAALPALPGDRILIRADEGGYGVGYGGVSIVHGGATDAPVTWMGVDVDLAPAKIKIAGQRPIWALPSDPEQVTDVSAWPNGGYGLFVNASHLAFKSFSISRKDRAWIFGTVDDLLYEDQELLNVRDGFYMANTRSVGWLTIRRLLAVGWSKKILRWYGDSHDWLVEDFAANSGRQSGDNFANFLCGDKTAGHAHGLVVRGRVPGGVYSGIVENCHDGHYLASGEPNQAIYWNGDGFALEPDNSDVLLQDLTSRGHTDAGVDSKAQNVTLLRVELTDNKRNLRAWGNEHEVVDSNIHDPRKRGGSGGEAQVMLLSADVQLKRCQISNAPLTTHPTFAGDSAYTENVLRVVATSFDNAADQTHAPPNTLVLVDEDDAVAPTPSTSVAARIGQAATILLAADQPCSWRIVGGADQAQFSITNATGVKTRRGQYLTLAAQTSIGSRLVEVEAADANLDAARINYAFVLS